jgi:hypothetical protein
MCKQEKILERWEKIAFTDLYGFPQIGPITKEQYDLEVWLNENYVDVDEDLCPN